MNFFNSPVQTPIIITLVFLSVVLIVISIPSLVNSGPIGAIRTRKYNFLETMHKDLFVEGQSAKQQQLWTEFGAIAGAILVFYFSRNILLAIAASVLIWFIPDIIFKFMQKDRREKFDENLPIALDQLNSATKAGLTLSQAIEEVSGYAPHPISQEFRQITSDQELGIDLPTALKTARGRVKSKTFSLVCTALLVNIELGGNLPAAMEVMSGSLKEIWRLDQKLNTAATEGKKGGMILCIMPIVILLMVLVMQPDLIETLLSSIVGYVVLFMALFFYLAGLYWMYRILQFDI